MLGDIINYTFLGICLVFNIFVLVDITLGKSLHAKIHNETLIAHCPVLMTTLIDNDKWYEV